MSGSYTVTRNRNCVCFTGPIPITDLVALTQAWIAGSDPADAYVVDALLSEAVGATFVCGPASATLAWRAELGLPITAAPPAPLAP